VNDRELAIAAYHDAILRAAEYGEPEMDHLLKRQLAQSDLFSCSFMYSGEQISIATGISRGVARCRLRRMAISTFGVASTERAR
jgi:hypothetical protein